MVVLQNSNKTGAGYEQLVRSGENMKRSAQKTAKKVGLRSARCESLVDRLNTWTRGFSLWLLELSYWGEAY